MSCYRIIAGFATSTVVGHFVVAPLVRWMWRYVSRQDGITPPKQRGSLSLPLGMVERALYTAALILGAPQLIGVWLAIKVAAKWKGGMLGRSDDNIWLIGTAMSLFFGFLGAWIALGKVPSFGAH